MNLLGKVFDSEFVICSIDVGTATSSVSFVHVKAGDTFDVLLNKVHRVDTWPHYRQKMVDVPSALCYRDGQPIPTKMGANAGTPTSRDNWELVEAFKRHVHRLGATNNDPDVDRSGLPSGVTLKQVYEDWIRFLFNAGEKSFRSANQISDALWKHRMVVFVAPNNWAEAEKANVRQLIHRAGCVEYEAHIRFARESEATLHFCLYHGLSNELTTPVGLEFFICNAGAAQTDLGLYKVSSVDPLHFVEVVPARTFKAGSSVAEETIGDDDEEDVNDEEDDEPSTKSPIELIQDTVREMLAEAPSKPKFLITGGGYSNDKSVQSRLNDGLSPLGITVTAPLRNPGRTLSKSSPTVDGGLYSCLHNFVTARAVVFTYGINVVVRYDDANPEHRRRAEKCTFMHAGIKHIEWGWSTIARKGEIIKDGDVRKRNFNKLYSTRPTDNALASVTLFATDATNPTWVRDEKGENLLPGVREICTISGPLLIDKVKILEQRWGGSNIAYRIPYHFDIDFGSVTSQARVVWDGINDKPAFAPATFHPPHDAEAVWN